MFRRRHREISIFSLSALDLFAMAMGVFLIFGVVMAPFFLQTREGSDQTDGLAEQAEQLRRQLRRIAAQQQQDLEQAAALQAQAAALKAQAAALQEQTQRMKAQKPAPRPPRPQPVAPPSGTRPLLPGMDLVFVIDSTASMRGELEHLAKSIDGIIEVLHRISEDLRVGLVTYRDFDNSPWPVRSLPLTRADATGRRTLGAFARGLEPARSGGKTPTESVLSGLEAALGFRFRDAARARVLVIGDAGAHPDQVAPSLEMARAFARAGRDRRISTLFVRTLASQQFGSGADARYFQDLAKAGGGRYAVRATSLMGYVVEEALAEGTRKAGKAR